MGAPAVVMAKEVVVVARPGMAASPTWEEELRLLAFAVWQRACCPEKESDQDCLEAEAWCHASCL